MKAILTPEAFVKAWQKAKTTVEVAEIFGRRPNAMSCRAANYRKHGIPLKLLPGRRPRLDYPKLIKLAKECAK